MYVKEKMSKEGDDEVWKWTDSPKLTWINVHKSEPRQSNEGNQTGKKDAAPETKALPLVIGTTFLEFKNASYQYLSYREYNKDSLEVCVIELPVASPSGKVFLLSRPDIGQGEVWKKTDALRAWKKSVRGKINDILAERDMKSGKVLIPRVGPQDVYEFRRMGKERQLIIDEYGVFYGKYDPQRLIHGQTGEDANQEKEEPDDPSKIVALSFIVVIVDACNNVKLSKARMPAGPRPGERLAMSRCQDKGGIWEVICNLLQTVETMRTGATSTDIETYAKQPHRWRYFVLLDQGFLKDSMNYTLLPGLGWHREKVENTLEGIVHEHVSSRTQRTGYSASGFAQPGNVKWEDRYTVYGLLHQLYLLTVVGQSRMLEFYLSPTCPYPRCPYVKCKRTRCFPVGLSTKYPSEPVKFYCPVCAQIYNPVDDRDNDIPGAFFGPSYIHLLIQRYPDLAQLPEDDSTDVQDKDQC